MLRLKAAQTALSREPARESSSVEPRLEGLSAELRVLREEVTALREAEGESTVAGTSKQRTGQSVAQGQQEDEMADQDSQSSEGPALPGFD
jgi:hypothetical protein